MGWERKWTERAFLKALSCSPSNDALLPTLLLTSSFPTSAFTPPSGVSVQVLTWESTTVPFLAGELKQVPARTGFDLGFSICKWRVPRGSSGAPGLAQGKHTLTQVVRNRLVQTEAPSCWVENNIQTTDVLVSCQRHLLVWWLELEGGAREGAHSPRDRLEALGRSALHPTELSVRSGPGAGRTDPAHL